jgi:Ni,Fe-hydrogenase III small subunit
VLEPSEYPTIVHGYLGEFIENCRLVEGARDIGDIAVARALCLPPFDLLNLGVVAEGPHKEADNYLIGSFIKSGPVEELSTVTAVTRSDVSVVVPRNMTNRRLIVEHAFLLAGALRAAIPVSISIENAFITLHEIMEAVRGDEEPPPP